VNLGDTFLGGSEVHGEDHLWIVINDPAAHGNSALIVNISTLRPRADTSCLLHRGDHPFIRHDSYVRFGSARAVSCQDVGHLFAARRLRPHQSASATLVARIRAAALASTKFPPELCALL
jgi:CTP:molybdopterin cytidylyltransferase MocA